MDNNNVIRFKTRAQKNIETNREKVPGTAQIVDMTERRQEILVQERRKVKRTILTEFLGAMTVIPQRGLQKVSLYDLSDDGLAFDMDSTVIRYQVGDEIAMRVYMNRVTYFPFIVKILNARDIPEEGVSRYGVSFAKGTINDVALHHFVKFIENVSASLRSDTGDILVSGLNR